MVWKCRCGHFNDHHYDKCFTCGAPQPGTMRQGEIGFTIILDYVVKGKSEVHTVSVKGPVTISTDPKHTRVLVTVISVGGASTELASYEWPNMSPHGCPIQIYPLAEGGFEVSSSNPMFMIDGSPVRSIKNRVESGVMLSMSDTMVIKLEDSYGRAFTKGALSPVGSNLPEDIPKELLYCPQGSKYYYYNGLSAFATSIYMASGIKMHTPLENADLGYLNKFFLKEYGIRLKNAKDKLKELSSL